MSLPEALSFKAKLVVVFLLIGILPLFVLGWLTVNQAHHVLREKAGEELSRTLLFKKMQVEQYLDMTGRQLKELSLRDGFAEWMTGMKAAFHRVSIPANTQTLRERLKARFDLSFVPEYRKHQGNRTPPDTYIALLDDKALFWQERMFVHDDRVQGSDSLEMGDSVEQFIRFRDQFDPMMRQQLASYDYYDLFLVDNQSGHVVYAVQNEIDLATSLKSGPFAQTGLGDAYRRVLAGNKGETAPVMVDFSPYFPSYDAPSAFMAVPVLRSGDMVGILMTQIHFQSIDKILNDRKGRGKSVKITFLDRHGMDVMGKTSGDERRGEKKDGGGGDEAVTETMTTENSGNDGFHSSRDYLWARIALDMYGLSGSLEGRSALKEVMAPIDTLDRTLTMTVWMTLLLVSLLAVATGKILLAPLVRFSATAGRIASGDWSARVPVGARDELGMMGLAFNSMAQRVQEEYWIKENMARLGRLFPSIRGVEPFAETLLRELLNLLVAVQGAFFLQDRGTGRYALVAGDGMHPRREETASFAPGEGIVGRCAVERRILIFDEWPEGTWTLTTGLGSVRPFTLLALPLNYQEQTRAVAVFAANHPFSPVQRHLLEEISLLGGLALDNLARVGHIEELLEETRAQAAELEMGQQELEQMNLELEKNSQDLRLSEELLRNQNEELEAGNKILEEQSQLLQGRNEQLANAHADLERASRYKSEFLASMSHELRTPLNSILILAHALVKNVDGTLTDAQVEDAEVIHQSGRELLEMINEILDLSRIEAGRMELHPEETQPLGLAEEIRRQFEPLARKKGLRWQVTVDERLPASFWVDQEKIRRIVKNLVANAFKFTDEGAIVLRMGREEAEQGRGPFWVISVTDTGCGIDSAVQEQVFEAFRQVGSRKGGTRGGVGLGLAIARKLAGLISGTIRLHSEPGRGSTFSLWIPWDILPPGTSVGAEPVCAPPSKTTEPDGIPDEWLSEVVWPMGTTPEGDRNVRGLLVIEDDPIFANSVRQLAEHRKFQVWIGGTGREGLALAVRMRPEGILLDLGLPDMPGEEVLRRLRGDSRTRGIAVHIVSGREDPGEEARQGSLGFLSKPVADAEVLKILNRMMPTHAGKRGRLLLVEDHSEMRRSIIELIGNTQVEVVEAARGDEALERLAEGSFDCMVLDLGLPDMEGTELLERMTALGRLPPVIIHSARDLTRKQHDLLLRYTDSIIVKGPNLETRLRDEIILFLNRVIRDHPEVVPTTVSSVVHREELFAGKNVLLVDDDARNVFSMTRSLERKGLKVRMAGNGAEALEHLRQGSPVDLVLMDIMMPVMDGYEAMRQLRSLESCQTLPVLALTAKAMPEDQKKCLEAGANDYLTKPVDMDRLFEMMRIWFEDRKSCHGQ
ncbi:MAG: response regulator [Magnetococcales bacterium]|nr:response regulator [Magnetococcales bacterium]